MAKSYKELIEDLELESLEYELTEGNKVGGYFSSYSRAEKEREQGDDDDDDIAPQYRSKSTPVSEPHTVHINGKPWKTFDSHAHATNIMHSMLRKDSSKKITVVKA